MQQANVYVGGKEASKILGVHQRTLYEWDKKKLIDVVRTPGGKRMYAVQKYLNDKKMDNRIKDNNEEKKLDIINEKIKIGYVRVSSRGQKDDMERQKKELQTKYPNHVIIEDIGSGLNLNKRGIKKIVKLAIEGKIEELVVTYKDKLTRCGYELIESLIKDYSGGKITIMNQSEELGAEEEMMKDLMGIMNVYVAKMNGMRKYNKQNKDKNLKNK